MDMTIFSGEEIRQLSLPAAIILLSLVVLRVGQTLSESIKKLSERRPDIERQTAANFRLASTPEGRDELRDFYFSELEVAVFFEAMTELLDESESYEDFRTRSLELVYRLPERLREDESKWWKWTKSAGKKIAGKLFDKANDLVKSALGG
ncbi:hypothetical protein [Pseudomonas sp. Pc102]|uniref:hypothetical protein n=1 Tax=Pseudomonas sp. Pc102 TaxID=2678261 RepID=UPI001BCC2AE9|nr:hypothetical protein [Pseudomonas sp. Pc102]